MDNREITESVSNSKRAKRKIKNFRFKQCSFSIPRNKDGSFKTAEQISFDDIMRCWPPNEKNFNSLIKIAGYNKLVPLVGAGITKDLTKEGNNYPAWKDLFAQIAIDFHFQQMEIDEVTPQEGKPFNYEEKAQKIENMLGKTVLQEKLRELFSPALLDNDAIKKSPLFLLPKLKPQVILTTNYDCAIERAYSLNNYSGNIEKIVPTTTTRAFAKLFREIDPQINETTILYKFHGDVADEGKTHDLILSESAYDSAYGTIKEIENETSTKDIVRNLYYFLFSKTILFLGCSLSDDRIMKLIQHNIVGEHYAIVACSSNQEAKMLCKRLNERHIRPIIYPRNSRECIRTIINKLIEMNTAWDIASVCRPKDEWLNKYLISINNSDTNGAKVEKHIIFFGGIFIGLRSSGSNYTIQLIKWLEKHESATIYYCYDSIDALKRRNSQLNSTVESVQKTDPNEKIRQIMGIPDYFAHNKDRVKLIPINYDLNGYAVIMDNQLFWSFKTHERSSKSPIIELDLSQTGSKKFLEYITYALNKSITSDDNEEGKTINSRINDLKKIIEDMDQSVEPN